MVDLELHILLLQEQEEDGLELVHPRPPLSK
jgi:hypothetical protein